MELWDEYIVIDTTRILIDDILGIVDETSDSFTIICDNDCDGPLKVTGYSVNDLNALLEEYYRNR